MPYRFAFDSNTIDEAAAIGLASFSRGDGWGIDSPGSSSALASTQQIEPGGDVDVVAVTLFGGRSYTLDIDRRSGDSQFVDVALDIIDMTGRLVDSIDDGHRRDEGANDNWRRDPFTTFTPEKTGIYFLAVRQWENSYIDGEMAWNNVSGDTGGYSLNIRSNSSLPNKIFLSSASQTRTFSDSDQIVFAGRGNDNLKMSGGRDIADGQSGRDTILGGSGDDMLLGGSGNDTLTGGHGNDLLRGGSENDLLSGNQGDDQISGNSGNDKLYGSVGNDTIWGGNDNDLLRGGEGNDFLRGGKGIDRMDGGDGDDVFQFRPNESPAAFGGNVDRIDNFASGDLIDLSSLSLAPLSWIGNAQFSAGVTNEIRFTNMGGNRHKVQVNTDFNENDAEVEFIVDVSQVVSRKW